MLFGISRGRSESGAVSSGIFVNQVLLGMSLWDFFGQIESGAGTS